MLIKEVFTMKITELKIQRLQKGLTQKEAADQLDISRGYLSQIENKQAVLTDELLLKIAKLYDVSVKELSV
jgi:transcriptional regulator with XRE-family HTH domain